MADKETERILEYVIDLENRERQKINVDTGWSVDVTAQIFRDVNRFIPGFVRRRMHMKKDVTISIEGLKVDPALVTDTRTLFTLVYNNVEYKGYDFPARIVLTNYENPFQVYLDQKYIYDCKAAQTDVRDSFPIRFKVVLRDPEKSSETIYAFNCRINIRFSHLENKPETSLLLDEDGTVQFTSVGDKMPKIGDFRVKLPNPLLRAPAVDFGCQVIVKDPDGRVVDDAVVFRGDGIGFTQFESKDMRTQVADSASDRPDRQSAKVRPVVTLPLYFDLSKIMNPLADKEAYLVSVLPQFKYSYESAFSPLPPVTNVVTLLKDTQLSELMVSAAKQWGVPFHTAVAEGEEVGIGDVVFTRGGTNSTVDIKLANKASDTSWRKNRGNRVPGVRVRGFSVQSHPYQGNACLLGSRGEILDINSVFTIDSVPEEAKSAGGKLLANGDGETVKVRVSFRPKRIAGISGVSDFRMQVASVVRFEYMEDTQGDAKGFWKEFALTLRWDLFQAPNPEWLSVDYGSSAIVCFYGVAENNIVLNLNNARKEVYAESEFSDDKKKDNLESGTPFLPSDILLNETVDDTRESLCSQSKLGARYHEMALLLAPTSSLIVTNFRRQLPCLKILMGNEMLPQNPNYEEFKYSVHTGGEVKRRTAEEFERIASTDMSQAPFSMLRIENIFRESYHTLFRFFVAKAALSTDKKAEKGDNITANVNQVVLTFPNTYTPRNLQTLRDIVCSLFDCARTVKFVSESDAVAVYYMKHWHDYHPVGDDINVRENILVYDMGAGTLDITYLTKTYDPKNRRHFLEIKGKIGSGKAGNYIDYIIARILADILVHDRNFKKYVQSGTKDTTEEVLDGRVRLKEIIKHQIKPIVDTQDLKTVFDALGDLVDPDMVADLLESKLTPISKRKRFKDFIDDVTVKILDRLKAFIAEGSMAIDTVILSGRSLRLKPLQEALMKALPSTCRHIMLDQPVHGDRKEQDRSKIAVAEGAKIFVESCDHENSDIVLKTHRLHASYGVAYKPVGGWIYTELISSRQSPYRSENSGSFSRPGGALAVTGLGSASQICLVQTYLSQEDTAEALRDGNFEFVTIVEAVPLQTLRSQGIIHGDSINCDVLVDENNNIALEINGTTTEGHAPQGVSLLDEVTKNSLWPISIG